MSEELQTLYQQVILDHARNPQGAGLLGHPSSSSHQVNPTCGDEIILELHMNGERIESLRWEGHGCVISQASASLLAGMATGLTLPELVSRVDAFRLAMRSRGAIQPDADLLGDAVALGGVSRYIARIKCATLAWVAAEEAAASTHKSQ
ncbi:MAG: SUF system NifU family Fe-S cluster assembly protein [Actinobacteria bacterium]|nr:SUF system NifU family Fe-S cluster assembly protein [Actinomycetota bacterium]